MNNFEKGKRLIEDAREYKEDAIISFQKENWNRTIRRAQESVELYLKGFMEIIGIEVPKIHDVGKIFVNTCRRKKIKLEKSIGEKIIEISSFLSEKRAPAFYREEEFGREDARRAIESVKFISQSIEKLLKEIIKNE